MSLPGARRAALSSLVAATLALPGHADSRALATVPIPPGANARAIASDIVQNGRGTSIASLSSTASVHESLAFYRERWPDTPERKGHLEERLGEWSLVSRIEDGALLVVQLRDGASGTEGLLSAVALAPAAPGPVPPPAMPAGGELLSSTASRDGAAVATTSVVSSTARPGEVAAFYRDRLVRDGWTLVSDRVHDGSPVLLLDRRGARVEIVVAAIDGRSIVLFNEVHLDG